MDKNIKKELKGYIKGKKEEVEAMIGRTNKAFLQGKIDGLFWTEERTRLNSLIYSVNKVDSIYSNSDTIETFLSFLNEEIKLHSCLVEKAKMEFDECTEEIADINLYFYEQCLEVIKGDELK